MIICKFYYFSGGKSTISLFLWILSTLVFTRVQSQCTFSKTNESLNCRNRNLTTIPLKIPPQTKIIDLSDNNIQKLDKNAFNACLSVVELYLANNNITQIHYGVFGYLNNLQILDLSNNYITNFQVETPVSLEILYLDGNPLSNENIFQQRLQFLKYLSMAGASLTQAPVFSNFLPVLQYLDLQDNPALIITADDLMKLQHLKILYISPRIFSGRGKIQKCKEFVQAARTKNIEVKSFACYPDDKFEIRSKNFERKYQLDTAMYDYPENVIWPPKERNQTCLHDLQTLVSNGLTNFIKSILMDRKESEMVHYKVKEPVKMEDFKLPRIHLYDVSMTGFPALNVKERELRIGTVDAEEIKRFQVEYRTSDPMKDILITGKFNTDDSSGTFNCKFTNTHYETKRRMLRRYDFRIWPTNIQETLGFEKMDCTTSLNNQFVDSIINSVLAAMSKSWLDSACVIANAVTVSTELRNASRPFSNLYKDRVVRDVIREGIDHLRKINIDSFDVSPSTYIANAGTNADLQGLIYNIKIFNLFNYTDYDVQYKTDDDKKLNNILVDAVISYGSADAAKLVITAKNDPSEAMNIFVQKIEFHMKLELKSINKNMKLNIADVSVSVIEKPSTHFTLVTSIVKKYVGLELAKEFKRSLSFLTAKIDFYSLNVD